MTINAALLDEHGVYLGMEQLEDESKLTARHLPSITSCDLPPGKYLWVPDERNAFGGAFWPLDWLKRIGVYGAPLAGLAERLEKLK